MKIILNKWLSIILITSFVALTSALIAEYFFNLMPCEMCLKQRHPYYLIIFFSIIFYFFSKTNNILLFIINELAILYGLFYAVWHVAIEQKFLSGPASCSGTSLQTNSIENLKEQITNQPIINCSEIIWTVVGLSAATINSLLLLFLLIFNSIYIIKYIYESKKAG